MPSGVRSSGFPPRYVDFPRARIYTLSRQTLARVRELLQSCEKRGAKSFSPTNKRELVCFLALPRDLPSSLFLRWMCVAVFVCKKEVGFCFLKKMKKSWWLALWRKCVPKAGRIGKDRFCLELVQRGITLSYALSYGMIVGFDASVHWMVELIFVLTFGNGILQSCSSEFISGLCGNIRIIIFRL